MDLTKIRKQKKIDELKQLYKYDLAIMKQHRPDFEFDSQQNELETLAGLHLSRQIQKALEEFANNIGGVNSLPQFIQMGIICNEGVGKLAGSFEEQQDFTEDEIEEALETINSYRDKFRGVKDD